MEVTGFTPDTNLNYEFPNNVLNAPNPNASTIILHTNSSQDWLRGNQIKLPNSIFRGISLQYRSNSVQDRTHFSKFKLFIAIV